MYTLYIIIGALVLTTLILAERLYNRRNKWTQAAIRLKEENKLIRQHLSNIGCVDDDGRINYAKFRHLLQTSQEIEYKAAAIEKFYDIVGDKLIAKIEGLCGLTKNEKV